ncbi:hypothetical protein [Amycolatopsis minnesotensis]|uniref:DUF2207 domain-containing protein n=1 Tax=Amycolatopsis minnesotensis TaxID=337894 RepID=A0ABN2RI80_9PSEU
MTVRIHRLQRRGPGVVAGALILLALGGYWVTNVVDGHWAGSWLNVIGASVFGVISLVSAVAMLYRRFFRKPRLDELLADARGLTRVVSGTVKWSVGWHELRGAELKRTFTGYDETEAGPEAYELVLAGTFPRHQDGRMTVDFELTPGEAGELRRVIPARFGGAEEPTVEIRKDRIAPGHPRGAGAVPTVVVHLQAVGTGLVARIGTLGVVLALGFFLLRRYADGVLHDIAYPAASFGLAMVFVAVGLKVSATSSKQPRIELTARGFECRPGGTRPAVALWWDEIARLRRVDRGIEYLPSYADYPRRHPEAVFPGSEPGWYRLPVKMSRTGAKNFAHAVETRWPAFLETGGLESGAPPAPITRGAT